MSFPEHFRGPRPAWLLTVTLVAAGALLGCDVDTEMTPHKKELAERRRRLAQLEADAAVPTPEPALPRRNVVVVGIDREPRHLNPALVISRWGYRIAMHNVFETLLKRDPKTNEPRPNLATEWTRSPDGKVYRITLRKDVTWHDGKPLTSRDVWYSLGRVHDRGTELGPLRRDLINQFLRITTLGPHSVRITLAHRNSYLLDHLCEFPILPYHRYGRSIRRGHPVNQRPVGTGPFRFARWIRASEIRLATNQRYWGAVPRVEGLHFKVIPDPAKMLTELKRGVIDVLPAVARQHYPDQITAWVKRRFRELWSAPPGFNYILWNTRHPILADFRVRRALVMLVNRPRIIKEVHRGLAREIAGPFWRKGGLGNRALKPWPFDPVRARNLLDNAGWRDRDGDKIRDLAGQPMRIVLLRPVHSRVAEDELKIMVGEFRKSGVDLVPVQTDWKMMRRLLGTRRFMAAALSWRGRPYEDLSDLLHSAGRANFGVMGSIQVDRLLGAMRNALTRQQRAAHSAELEKLIWSYQPAVFTHGRRVLSLVHRRIHGVRATPDWLQFQGVWIGPPAPAVAKRR